MYVDIALQRQKLTPKERVARGENPLTVWREHRGLTARQLATAVGAHETVVRTIEANNVPLVRDARLALAKALGIKPSDLGV